MSQDCWGPSPEDYAFYWKAEQERQAKVKSIKDEMTAALPAAFQAKMREVHHRYLTIDQLREALDAGTGRGPRDDAFRSMFWSWLNRGIINMNGQNHITLG